MILPVKGYTASFLYTDKYISDAILPQKFISL